MRLSHLPLTLLCCMLLCATIAHAQSTAEAAARFDSLMARIDGGDTTVNFTDLRMAYAGRKGYNAYAHVGYADLFQEALKHARAEHYDSAVHYTQMIFAINPLDIETHILSDTFFKQLGDKKRAAYHRRMATGLLRSILNSGDGKTPSTAFVVIGVQEEYALLYVMGLRSTSQALDHSDGHILDKLSVVDVESSEKSTLYFNVDIPFASMNELLKDEKEK